MNYRHAFHAGNFADCFKHALLLWLLDAMLRKPAPFFVLDTHAGAGACDLGAGPAQRTGEWRGGIGRLLEDTPEVLAEYVGLVRRLAVDPRLLALREATHRIHSRESGKPEVPHSITDRLDPHVRGGDGIHDRMTERKEAGEAMSYPGSPALIRARLRPGDRLACCELHPEDYQALRHRFARDPQVGVHHRDGWEALGALLPPAERRGLVLIDPPYEASDEFDRLLGGLRTGHTRFAAGVFAAWYPIKHRAPSRRFLTKIAESGLRDVVAAELWLRAPLDPGRLNGCGLLVVNPPFRFGQEAPALLAALLDRLGGREIGEDTALIRLADE